MRAVLKYAWGLVPRNYQRWTLGLVGLLLVLVVRWSWVSLTGDIQRWHNVVAVVVVAPVIVVGIPLFLHLLQKRDDTRMAPSDLADDDSSGSLNEHDVSMHASVIQPRYGWWRQTWRLFRRGGE